MWAWFVDQVWPNIVASILCGVAVWFWKIRPHLKRAERYREHVRTKLDELHAHVANIQEDSD